MRSFVDDQRQIVWCPAPGELGLHGAQMQVAWRSAGHVCASRSPLVCLQLAGRQHLMLAAAEQGPTCGAAPASVTHVHTTSRGCCLQRLSTPAVLLLFSPWPQTARMRCSRCLTD